MALYHPLICFAFLYMPYHNEVAHSHTCAGQHQSRQYGTDQIVQMAEYMVTMWLYDWILSTGIFT